MKTYQKPYTEYFELVGKSLMTFDISDGPQPENPYGTPARNLYL